MSEYKAKLSQNDEGDPTAAEVSNTLNASINWARIGHGYYVGVLDDPILDGATVFCYQPVRDNSGDPTTGSAINFTMDKGGSNTINLNSYGEGEDGIIGRRDIEGSVFVCFEVYPPETRLPPH